DHIAEFDLLPNPAPLGNGVGVETDLQSRVVTFKLIEDPLPRDADAAIGLSWIGKRVASLEALQFAQNRGHALLGYFPHNLLDHRVQTPRRRLNVIKLRGAENRPARQQKAAIGRERKKSPQESAEHNTQYL